MSDTVLHFYESHQNLQQVKTPRLGWMRCMLVGNMETHSTKADVIYRVLKKSNICALFPAKGRRMKAHCFQPLLPLYPCMSVKANPNPLRNAPVLVQDKMQSPQKSLDPLWFVQSDVLCLWEWILRAEPLQIPSMVLWKLQLYHAAT